jgi:hypothetical protein
VIVRFSESSLDEDQDYEETLITPKLSVLLFKPESSVSDSDSNSDSDLELTGRTVSRRGRPRDLEMARMYSKGR